MTPWIGPCVLLLCYTFSCLFVWKLKESMCVGTSMHVCLFGVGCLDRSTDVRENGGERKLIGKLARFAVVPSRCCNECA